MPKLRLLVNTQTPLVQFLRVPRDTRTPAEPSSVDLTQLTEGVDFRFSPGGVTRMVYPLLRKLLADGVLEDAHWVSLNPNAPATAHLPGISLHHVAIDPERMAGYGTTKEAIWATAHGLVSKAKSEGLFWTDDATEYTFYNRTTAMRIRELDHDLDFDLFYIHDFQQLPVGQMLGTLKPKIFRWHIPFDVRSIPVDWRPVIQRYLSAYDRTVVSSDRYRRELERLGHRGDVLRIYPYIDPAEYRTRPTAADVGAVCEKFGILRAHSVGLIVARMDPTKGQDRALAALALVKNSLPNLRLVFVGNGSFSSSKGGLGLSKSDRWRARLDEETHRAGISDRVVFTGHVTQAELDALYERSDFSILPSVNEGFGLVVVESWIHRRPALVTDRAGVAELITDGENGLLFDPDSATGLARQIRRITADDGTLRRRLVDGGRRAARTCSLETAARQERELFESLVGG